MHLIVAWVWDSRSRVPFHPRTPFRHRSGKGLRRSRLPAPAHRAADRTDSRQHQCPGGRLGNRSGCVDRGQPQIVDGEPRKVSVPVSPVALKTAVVKPEKLSDSGVKVPDVTPSNATVKMLAA